MTPVPRGRPARRLGYMWERELTARIRSYKGYDAVRIGAPSALLPDVLAWTNEGREPCAYVFECKATSGSGAIRVPARQLRTPSDWCVSGPLRGATRVRAFLACRWSRPRGAEAFFDITYPVYASGHATATRDALTHHSGDGGRSIVHTAPLSWAQALKKMEGTA